MAPLPLPQSIERFVQNENRLEIFTHGDASAYYQTRSGEQVPSLRKFLKDSLDAFEQHAAELTLGIAVEDAVISIGSTALTVKEWLSLNRVEPRSPTYWSLGFVGDGQGHRLSEFYPSLAAAQAVFPRATALTEYIDGHAVQRDMDLQAQVNDKRAKIVMPACRWWSNGLDATGINFTIEGAANGGTLCLMDRMDGVPAVRQGGDKPTEGQDQPLCIERMMFLNVGATKAGSQGFFVNHSTNAGILSAFVMSNVCFRGFASNTIMNVGRGLSFENVVVFGPDFETQPNAGIKVLGTPENSYGMFSHRYDHVIIANYRWGWDYQSSRCSIEGHSFYSCAAYNGLGMVNVNCDGLGHGGNPGYKSLLWSFDNCDWEGQGYAVQMKNCRNVKISSGFYIFSAPYDLKNNPYYRPDNTPYPGGTGRRMFNFLGCSGVSMQDVEMASSDMNGSVLIQTDEGCDACKFEDSVVRCYNNNAVAGIILSGAYKNTIVEKNTKWISWPGGPKVFYTGDGNKANQISYTDVDGSGGSVTDQGVYCFRKYEILTSNGDGLSAVNLPLRANGTPFFTETPFPQITAENSNAFVQAPIVRGRSTTEIQLRGTPNDTVGVFLLVTGK